MTDKFNDDLLLDKLKDLQPKKTLLDEIANSEKTTGIAGSEKNTTVQRRITRRGHTCVCNKHVTPAPEAILGDPNYYYDSSKSNSNELWVSRFFDFLNRHQQCGHTIPSYYYNYGYKYITRFTDVLYYKLTPEGKKWLILARKKLQKNMEYGFKCNKTMLEFDIYCEEEDDFTAHITTSDFESLELDENAFLEFAYATHAPAYIDGGLKKLSCKDLIEISDTPDYDDSVLSSAGRSQIGTIMAYLFLYPESYLGLPLTITDCGFELVKKLVLKIPDPVERKRLLDALSKAKDYAVAGLKNKAEELWNWIYVQVHKVF